MKRSEAQFATDPQGLVYVVDDRDQIVCGPVDPADPGSWVTVSEFVRGYLLDSR